MEEPAISYDGSGIVDDSELLSDDEDYEVLSGSGIFSTVSVILRSHL